MGGRPSRTTARIYPLIGEAAGLAAFLVPFLLAAIRYRTKAIHGASLLAPAYLSKPAGFSRVQDLDWIGPLTRENFMRVDYRASSSACRAFQLRHLRLVQLALRLRFVQEPSWQRARPGDSPSCLSPSSNAATALRPARASASPHAPLFLSALLRISVHRRRPILTVHLGLVHPYMRRMISFFHVCSKSRNGS